MDVIRHTHSAPGAMVSTPTDSKLVVRLGRNGDFATGLLVFKAMVGVGLFALPYAFKTVGIGGGIISMAVAGLLCAYTNALLIRIKSVVARDTFRKHLNYVSLVEHCFGRWGGNVVLFLIVFTTLGGTAAYTIFMGQILQSLVPSLSLIAWAGIISLIVWPLCLTDNGVFLAWASILGNVGVALVTAIVLAQAARLGTLLPLPDYTMFNASGFMSAFGTIGFLFAASTTIITIQRAATNKGRFNAVMSASLAFTFVICGAFSILCYLYFGASTCSIIVLNIGSSASAVVAKVAIVVDLVFSYPLALSGGREVLERSFLRDDSPHLRVKQFAIRSGCVLISFLVAFFPQFGIVVSLVGGVSVSALAFILPCLMLIYLRHVHTKAHAAQMALVEEHRRGLHAHSHDGQSFGVSSSPAHGHARMPLLIGDGASGASGAAASASASSAASKEPSPMPDAVGSGSGSTAAAGRSPTVATAHLLGHSHAHAHAHLLQWRELSHTPEHVPGASPRGTATASTHHVAGSGSAAVGAHEAGGSGHGHRPADGAAPASSSSAAFDDATSIGAASKGRRSSLVHVQLAAHPHPHPIAHDASASSSGAAHPHPPIVAVGSGTGTGSGSEAGAPSAGTAGAHSPAHQHGHGHGAGADGHASGRSDDANSGSLLQGHGQAQGHAAAGRGRAAVSLKVDPSNLAAPLPLPPKRSPPASGAAAPAAAGAAAPAAAQPRLHGGPRAASPSASAAAPGHMTLVVRGHHLLRPRTTTAVDIVGASYEPALALADDFAVASGVAAPQAVKLAVLAEGEDEGAGSGSGEAESGSGASQTLSPAAAASGSASASGTPSAGPDGAAAAPAAPAAAAAAADHAGLGLGLRVSVPSSSSSSAATPLAPGGSGDAVGSSGGGNSAAATPSDASAASGFAGAASASAAAADSDAAAPRHTSSMGGAHLRESALHGHGEVRHREKARQHMQALHMLGVGSAPETVLLWLVAAFGLVVLVMTTVQSVREAIAPPGDVPAVCQAGA